MDLFEKRETRPHRCAAVQGIHDPFHHNIDIHAAKLVRSPKYIHQRRLRALLGCLSFVSAYCELSAIEAQTHPLRPVSASITEGMVCGRRDSGLLV